PWMHERVRDFPAADSPATPSISPLSMCNEILSSAVSTPRRVWNSTRRSRTSRRVLDSDISVQAWIQGVAQPVAQQVHRQDEQHERHSGKYGDPPFTGKQKIVSDTDQRAQRWRRRRDTDTQEGERGFSDDGRGQMYSGQHQYGTQHIGQHMLEEDGRGRHAGHPGSLNVF